MIDRGVAVLLCLCDEQKPRYAIEALLWRLDKRIFLITGNGLKEVAARNGVSKQAFLKKGEALLDEVNKYVSPL